MGRKALVLFACALVACGLDVVGSGPSDTEATDGVTPASGAGATNADASSSSPTEVPVVVADDPPDPADAASDAEAGATCAADGTSCTDGATCCSKGCNAYARCGVCSDTRGAACVHSSDCCRGLWCGDLGQGAGLVCNGCMGKLAFCDTASGPSDLVCCSGKCSFAYFYKGKAVHVCQ